MPVSEGIPEHAHAVLIQPLPDFGLAAGDVGVVVHVYPGTDGPAGYLLEVFAASGETLDVVSVPAEAVRSASVSDRLHVRTEPA